MAQLVAAQSSLSLPGTVNQGVALGHTTERLLDQKGLGDWWQSIQRAAETEMGEGWKTELEHWRRWSR